MHYFIHTFRLNLACCSTQSILFPRRLLLRSTVLAVDDVTSICGTKDIVTGNGISISAPGSFKKVQHTIPILEPFGSSTIACPPVMGGLGSWAGVILRAEIEMRI